MKKAPVGYQIWAPPHDGYQLAIFVRWVLNGGETPSEGVPPHDGYHVQCVHRHTRAGHNSKVKNVFCFKLDAKSVPEALATTIRSLSARSVVLARPLFQRAQL